MHIVTKLREENAAISARLEAVLEEVAALRAHLHSAKFAGTDADGSRRDWIATADVDRRLIAIWLVGEG